MAKPQFINHFSGTLSNSIGETDTVLSWSSPTSNAPVVAADSFIPITLLNTASPGEYEVVYVTAATATTLTVQRGKEGTTSSWSAGSTIVCAPTASVLGLSSIAGSQHIWSAITAQLIGGYSLHSIVIGPDGSLWQSLSDDNMGMPGSDGSNWQSLFNGYATQEWSKEQFLQLALATLQKVTGPVAFTGETEVPDTSDFTGKDALNAETAEGRYITSVPATGQTRIPSLVENSDGRVVFGGGTNNTVLANLADLPTQFNGVDSSGRGYGYQKFNDGTMIVFGYAYYSASTNTTGTVVTLPFSFPGKFIGLVCTDYGADNNAVAAYPESQSSFRCWAGAPTIRYLNTIFFYVARGTWK